MSGTAIPLQLSGTVTVPGTQAVSGVVGVILPPLVAGSASIGNVGILGTPSVTGIVGVNNFPATQAVSGTIGVNLPPLVAGSASIGNVGILGTSAVSGTVAINNFPATQAISGLVTIANYGTTGGVTSIVTVANLPTLQSVSGTVTIANLPSTQAVSLSSLPLPSGAATAANQVVPVAAGASSATAAPVQGVAGGHPLQATTLRTSGTWTDRSGTIATGGVSQVLAPANSSRNAWFVTNPPNATESLFINFTAAASTAASGSVALMPGGSYVDPPGFLTTEAITVTAATAGHTFTAKEA